VRPGRAAEHSPPSSAAVMEEQSYTSTHLLGHAGTVTGKIFFYDFYFINQTRVDFAPQIRINI